MEEEKLQERNGSGGEETKISRRRDGLRRNELMEGMSGKLSGQLALFIINREMKDRRKMRYHQNTRKLTRWKTGLGVFKHYYVIDPEPEIFYYYDADDPEFGFGLTPGLQPAYESHRWRPPPRGFLKLNFDAAISSAQQRSGEGVVIRNSEGRFVAAFSFLVPYHSDSLQAEAHALLIVVQTAHLRGFQKFIIESDNKNLIGLLQQRKKVSFEREVGTNEMGSC